MALLAAPGAARRRGTGLAAALPLLHHVVDLLLLEAELLLEHAGRSLLPHELPDAVGEPESHPRPNCQLPGGFFIGSFAHQVQTQDRAAHRVQAEEPVPLPVSADVSPSQEVAASWGVAAAEAEAAASWAVPQQSASADQPPVAPAAAVLPQGVEAPAWPAALVSPAAMLAE